MPERPDRADLESRSMPARSFPQGVHGSRLTQEQLEAAERTRAYHLRKLQGGTMGAERHSDSAVLSEA
jgi:hypothetical protein